MSSQPSAPRRRRRGVRITILTSLAAAAATIIGALYYPVAQDRRWFPFSLTPAPADSTQSCTKPTVRVDPHQGKVGDIVHVTACAFPAQASVRVVIGNNSVTDGRTLADGSFSADLSINSQYAGPPGTLLTIVVEVVGARVQASDTFTIIG